jgi:hypothetical protein
VKLSVEVVSYPYKTLHLAYIGVIEQPFVKPKISTLPKKE